MTEGQSLHLATPRSSIKWGLLCAKLWTKCFTWSKSFSHEELHTKYEIEAQRCLFSCLTLYSKYEREPG